MQAKRLLAILSVAIVPVLILGFAATASAKTIKMTYSNFFPPFHIQSKLAESWCKEVEKRTNGQVKIDYYPGGTLTKAPQTYDGVVEGLADIGFTVLAYSKGRFPVLGAVDLPMGYTSGVVATNVANDVLDKFSPKEFNDTEVMYLHAHGPGYIHTNKESVKNMAELKGLKIRATGNSATPVKALGATPVAQRMGDAYQSLQKGVVDGSAHPLESNKGWKLGEVLDYCIAENSVAYTTTFIVTMNKDKWAALPMDVQKTISEINKEWIVKHGQAWDESDVAGKQFFLEKGNKIITLDSAEAEKWKKAVSPTLMEYAAKLDKKGINGKEVVDFIVESIEKNK